MNRRQLLTGLSLLPFLGADRSVQAAPLAIETTFADLIEEARVRAASPYTPPPAPPGLPEELPPELLAQVRVRPQYLRELGAGYVLAPLPPGGPMLQAVPVRLLHGDRSELLAFRPEMYDAPASLWPADLPQATGFGGIALLFPLQRSPLLDEVLRLGPASLLRGTCRGGVFGPSARAIAVDTSSGRGEEFPAFVDFRIGQPNTLDRALPVYALLDGPSLSGAYAFSIRPGVETVVEVRAYLFLRAGGRQLGLAPIGTMFLYGPQDPSLEPELQPRLHDSCGLVMWRGDGEAIYRALANPREVRLSVFSDDGPRAFGFVQRQRHASAFAEASAQRERSPNLLVEPLHDWGAGKLHLVEIPLENPHFANVVAFWEPERAFAQPDSFAIAWRLRWGFDVGLPRDRLHVAETRIGRARDARGEPRPGVTAVEIDFAGPLAPGPLPVADAGATGGSLQDLSIRPLIADGRLRVSFTVTPTSQGPLELRCTLRHESRSISETWLGRLDAV